MTITPRFRLKVDCYMNQGIKCQSTVLIAFAYRLTIRYSLCFQNNPVPRGSLYINIQLLLFLYKFVYFSLNVFLLYLLNLYIICFYVPIKFRFKEIVTTYTNEFWALVLHNIFIICILQMFLIFQITCLKQIMCRVPCIRDFDEV